jgi:anti-anti-sigma factor
MDLDVVALDGNVTCVRLAGRLDSPGVDRLETRFTAAIAGGGRNGIVDLSQVSFVASMGIRMFITAARALNAKGAKMVLFGASELVQEVLDNVALDQIIPVVGSEQAALQQLAA